MSVESVTPRHDSAWRRAPRALEPPRVRPAQHELRRREHLGQGNGIDPVTGAPVDLLWVKGSGGDLGTLTEAGLAVLRLDRLRALVDVYPGRRPRGRDGRCLRLLPPRSGWRGAVDRHRDARSRRRPACRPPPPRFGDRARDRSRRRGPDASMFRRPCGLGRLAPSGLPIGPRPGGDPACAAGRDRGDPRRTRDHRLGRHLGRMRGAVARDHPDGRAVHQRQRRAGPVRPADSGLRATARA